MRHQAVQYAQYNWVDHSIQSADSTSMMIMTSTMLYLQRMSDVDNEVPSYSLTNVSLSFVRQNIWSTVFSLFMKMRNL